MVHPSKTSKIKLLHESASLNVSNLTFHMLIIYPKNWTNKEGIIATEGLIFLQVMFEPKFEPYILMKTREMPLYDEDVLDRMGDKALFTSDLNTLGYVLLLFHRCSFSFSRGGNNLLSAIFYFRYKFRVLPETFLVHHPHPISDNKLIQNNKIFLW